ncbi:biotin--[acetyl-CoA-carboxylase] ligase [Leuconostoc suionicum]|uniref:Bifunctional ligase/repressor BirA n=1 Tax=Leuconostoc suionicum TaxID=1511761 RepID=A0A2N9KFX5_9LACO|nr:biotin--[acetyl-CoA-carboxylase] ligase [Leuconostoc suionicum]MBE4727893.1 biotin--[acetyl-CoA-carboxylase] ligase [Leuconostoc suionicum]MCT4401416.1 biotin--[acetyl-CoA-carboxylase] ligase [Leuconostoc suionicum]MDI6497639.1 biotin--[acetyl-CoA-carboxylase] ligase [Leuconostoc suionicum]MDI6499711.1 biotin--[acetyl-CoA-carboxylase] ligase [Leuconostoc suionicum]MDI6501792.1 biotin--[acetyl-CoA-carboxylase] ligase [Leuconostoc suionicum]
MSTADKLLALLINKAGDWVSGEAIAQQLGITRTSIWKSVKKLESQGHLIESVRGQGYRYLEGTKISAVGIKKYLKSDVDLRVFDTIDSTNVYAREKLSSGEITKNTVIVSESMSAGIGRLGRKFFSPKNTGMYVTFALPLPVETIVNPGRLTTSTAVAVSKMVKEVFDIDLQFKWVNDLLYNNKKVGGILTEAITDFESQQFSSLAVGIGMNLATPDGGFPEEISQKAGALTDEMTVSRNEVVGSLINYFFDMYQDYQDGRYIPQYRKKVVGVGQSVELKRGQMNLTGIIREIDNDGCLVLDTKQGIERINSGEITKLLLPNNEYRG